MGVRAWGGASIGTSGAIIGGSNGSQQSDSVLFSGGRNALSILAGATFTGHIESTSGNTNGGDELLLTGPNNGSIDAGLIVGFAIDVKDGNSVWTLTGTGNPGINWGVSQGGLIGSSDAFQGNLTFSNNGFGVSPSVDFNQLGNGTYAGTISGAGTLIKDGAGTLNLSGNLSTFTGPFAINVGTVALQNTGDLHGADVSLNNPGAQFDISGTTLGTATIARLSGVAGSGVSLGAHMLAIANASAADIFGGTINGTGGLTLLGGTQTLSNTNIYSGDTTVSGGTLKLINSATIGNGHSLLTVANGTVDSTGLAPGSTLAISSLEGNGNINLGGVELVRNNAGTTYEGVIGGAGGVAIDHGGETFNGVNTYTGLTSVASNALFHVGDSTHTTAMITGDVHVDGGVLAGFGTVKGSVMLINDALLQPGGPLDMGTLTINGDLSIGDGSLLDFDFGIPGSNFATPGQSDHVVVGGNLSIDSSIVNVNNVGGMGPGLYNLSKWGGSLNVTNGGLAPPSGMSLQILTADKQINLINTQGLFLAEWDANGLAGPGAMGGGSGVWSLVSNTWSDTNGQFLGPMTPAPAFAIFGGAAGTVTVDNSNGNVSALGMQFVSDGYHLRGDAIDLVGQGGVAPVLRVSSGDTATIGNVLTGSGGFNKTDGGTLVLTGANSYTGNTTMSGGYLSVSSDANLGAAADALDFEGGTLEITGTAFTHTARNITWGAPGGGFDIDDAGNTFSVAQALGGSGGLLKSGAGTLVLSGANTYSGSTVISAGTLQGDSNSLQGNITDNGRLVFAQTGNGSFSGAVSGSGQLIKNGGGTLILSGTDSYTGGTTINAGTLQGDTKSLQGSIANNAALIFNQGSDGSFGGVVSGSGSLSKTGAGVLSLAGANSYAGGTTISAGTLQGDTKSLQGNVADNAALIFNQASDGSFGGVVSGSGNLTKAGAAKLTLTGANTYAGGTTIGAGTLQGDTKSLQGNIADNAALIFNQGIDGTYSGAISGSGTLTKSGAGLLILDGVNTYTGNTTVSAGTLEVGDSHSPTASISSNVTVGSGGTLRGHGSINGAVVSDGIVWAGGSTGTLSIAGNYTQHASGTLRLDVTPTQASMLKVGGQANLGGALDLIFAPGTYGSGKYALVQAGSLSGTFSTVVGTVPGAVASQIAYTGTEADLVLAQSLGHSVVTPMDGSVFGNMMRGVALAGQRDMSSVLDVALLSGDTSCGGDRTPQRQNISASCAGGAWAQYSGSALSLDGVDGMNSTAFGLLGGVDYALGDAVHLGVQGGAGQVNGNDKSGGNARAENVHGGVYAYANAGPIVLSALADWMHTDYHFRRASGIGAAVSTPGGQMLSGALQAAWPVQTGAWQFTPKVGVLFQRQTLGGFGETLSSISPNAASFPVDGTRSRTISLQPYAAIELKNSFVASGVTYVPELSLGYRYNTHDPVTPSVQVVAQDGTPFLLPGATQGRGFGTVNARITAQAGDSWSVYMGCQGLFGSRLRDNALNFGFNKRF